MSGSNPLNNTSGDSGNNPPSSNQDSSNNDQNNNNTNSSTNNSTTPEGNGITVSIQYTYLPLDGTNGTPQQQTVPLPFGAPTNNTTPGATTGQPAVGTNVPGNVAPGTLPTPAGAFVLSFRDIPSTTPQSRLESIIAITAELAMRRFHEMHSRPKGIPEEEFKKLPVLTLEQVKKLNNGKESECSICYEPYVEEPKQEPKDDTENKDKKRERSEDSDTDATEQINRIKRQRINAENNNSTLTPASSVPTSAGNERTLEQQASTESTNENSAADDDEHPKYLHSPVELPCHHIFGRECIYKWSRNENSCPLCRHRIAELTEAQNEQQNEFNNNATMQEFERIRNMLYNPSETAEAGASNGTNPGANTTTPSSTTGTNEPPRAGTEFNIPNGNPNIIFISPNDWNSISNRAARTGTSGPTTATASTTTSTGQPPVTNSGTASTTTSSPAGSAANSTRRTGFHWIPISMRNLNPFTNEQRTRSNPGPNGIANPATNAVNTDNPNSEERAYNDVHRFLDAVLNGVGASHNVQGAATTNTTTTTSTTTPPVNATATTSATTTPATTTRNSSTARLPLRNVPAGLQGHLRNIQEALMGRNQAGNNLFSTGVASFRGENGNVSTFELGNHPVPNMPVHNNTTGATTTTTTSTTAPASTSPVESITATTNTNPNSVNNDTTNTEQNDGSNDTPENTATNESPENNNN